ncbi:MAG: sulfatase [Lentisphaeria bacterium]|nr:sulfatase [Lentisphaeria bacterium]
MKPGSLAVSLLPLAAALHAADGPARPSVLIIHTDEHNVRTLGCYRARMAEEQAFLWGAGIAVETPHIDAIASRGALCERFYAASPVCTPSRASFVTGRYPQNTGAPANDRPMRDDMVTFAEVLRRAGYRTGYAGKWHLDGIAKPGWAPARKFGFEDNRAMFNRGHWKQFEDTPTGPGVKVRNARGEPTYDVGGADAASFSTDFLADKAIAFIRAHRGEPFCFMLSIPDPHGPNTVRPPYDTQFQHFAFQLPPSAQGAGRMENMAGYFGMVKCIDDNVGRIVATLQDTGILANTLVVFTADHGDMCGEHGRVNKGLPHDGSARIPFVIAYPGRVPPGLVIREALSTVDFKPTLLGLLGVPPDDGNEGRDASALFLTGRAPAGWEDVACSRHAGGGWLMAVNRRHKLVVYRDSDPCLFDLVADPFEMENLFGKEALRPTVRALGKALADYAARCREPHAEQPAIRADLDWAAEATGPYTPPQRAQPGAGGARRARAGGNDD